MERLIIIENGEEIVFNIESRVVTIGRSSKNDIPIKDRNASRRHCNIIKVGDSWFAVDCDSQNGTLVNQEPIKKQELEDGDKISVGAAEIIFMIAQEKPLQTEESMLADSPIKKHPLQDDELEVEAPPKKEPEVPAPVKEVEAPPKKEPEVPAPVKEVEVAVKQDKVVEALGQPAPPPVPPVSSSRPSTSDPAPSAAVHPKEVPLHKSSKSLEVDKSAEDVSQNSMENRSAEMRNRRSATAAKQVEELYKAFTSQFSQQVVGYDYVARLLFIALVNNEHCLLTGPPGAGKLFIVRTICELLGLSVQRVSNVGIENHIENSSKYNLETLFSNNLNFIDHNFQTSENVMTLVFDFLQNQKMPTERKTSNFQQVNAIIAGNLPSKQNSSQMMQYKDAFMFDIPLDYLGVDLETSILKQNIGVINRAKKPMNFTRCFGYFQMMMANSVVSDEVLKFIATIIHHSRPYQSQCEDVKSYFLYGCGRKAGLALLRAGQTHALLDNRKEVAIEDISKMSYYVLHHRVVINEEGKKAKKSKKQIIESLIKFAKENQIIMFPTSPKKLQRYLNFLGAAPQKKWGQNFLLDTQYHVAIQKAAELDPDDIVLEIGAGLGHLTQFLQPMVKKLFIVEIDPIMVKALNGSFAAAENIEIISEDILRKKKQLNPLVLQKVSESLGGKRLKIVANLPYNISAPIIVNFLSSSIPISQMVFMVQKEIAERIVSSPQAEFYGPLTVQTQIYAHAKILKYVPAHAFFPAPKVTSAILQIVPDDKLLHTINNIDLLRTLIQATFCLRRKKILNSLRKGANLPTISKENLQKLEEHFDLSRRPETFSVEEFIEMANILDGLLASD